MSSFSLNQLFATREIYFASRSVNRTSQAELASSQTGSADKIEQSGAKAGIVDTGPAGQSLSGSGLSYGNVVTTSLTRGTIFADLGLTPYRVFQRTATVSTGDEVSAVQADGTSVSTHRSTAATLTDADYFLGPNPVNYSLSPLGVTIDQTDSVSTDKGGATNAQSKITASAWHDHSIQDDIISAVVSSGKFNDGRWRTGFARGSRNIIRNGNKLFGTGGGTCQSHAKGADRIRCGHGG